VTKPRAADELRGLVYSLTDKPSDEGMSWYARPATLAIILIAMLVVLNIVFF
jgi:SSS family solute:Na+ symporter